MNELSQTIQDKINSLAELGDQYAEEGEFAEALDQYWTAWDLLPDPKTEWDAGLWLLVAIGDANFSVRDFAAGKDNLTTAMNCPEAPGNPFIHLRLGQCQFELGNKDEAADELTRAYMGVGSEIFEGEDDKYFEFLKTVLKPPADGW
mgnify:CR=1 FL=1|jgi:tetratricopeptide (TPR) repeat protein